MSMHNLYCFEVFPWAHVWVSQGQTGTGVCVCMCVWCLDNAGARIPHPGLFQCADVVWGTRYMCGRRHTRVVLLLLWRSEIFALAWFGPRGQLRDPDWVFWDSILGSSCSLTWPQGHIAIWHKGTLWHVDTSHFQPRISPAVTLRAEWRAALSRAGNKSINDACRALKHSITSFRSLEDESRV